MEKGTNDSSVVQCGSGIKRLPPGAALAKAIEINSTLYKIKRLGTTEDERQRAIAFLAQL